MPTKYVSVRPVFVDAARWTGDNAQEIEHLTGARAERAGEALRLHVDETARPQTVDVPAGHWVTHGDNGVRVVAPEEFHASYSLVDTPVENGVHAPNREQIAHVADAFAMEGGLD
jgi:hypothetical protein